MAELSPTQIQQLHTLLQTIQTDLTAQLEASAAGAAPVQLDEPIGRLSRMEAIQQQQMAAANRASSKRRLELIKLALQAIAEGEYGYCRSCEENIGLKRLQARPEVPFCLRCQQEREG